MDDVDRLLAMVKAQARWVAAHPRESWDNLLSTLYAEHQLSALTAGLSAEAAVEMADRLDGWIRQVLLIAPSNRPRLEGLN